MADILMSINPHWIELIKKGEKTVEIRKSQPKIYPPFDVYIYCTQRKERLLTVIKDGDDIYGTEYHGKPMFIKTYDNSYPFDWIYGKWGKVVGKFTCDCIELLNTYNIFENAEIIYNLPHSGNCCLTMEELEKYGNGKSLFGWHISNPVWFKEPLPLRYFGMNKPPQSWCYIKE